MSWISRMIQRGNTVSPIDALEAIGAFNQAWHCDDMAGSVSDPKREAHWRQKADEARRRAYRLSQGIDYDDLVRIAEEYWR